jgi:hypothetical protein
VNDPFILLPSNLGALAGAAADHSARYVLSGVRLAIADGAYEACATDGRQLAVVTGRLEHDPLEYPVIPELAEAPPGADAAVIPTREWKQAFKAAPRGVPVAVHLGAQESILGSSDGAEARVTRVPNAEGRYPPYEKVIPQDPPQASVDVDAEMLLSLLKVAVQYGPGREGSNRLTLEIRGPGAPGAAHGQRRAAAPGAALPAGEAPLTQRPSTSTRSTGSSSLTHSPTRR